MGSIEGNLDGFAEMVGLIDVCAVIDGAEDGREDGDWVRHVDGALVGRDDVREGASVIRQLGRSDEKGRAVEMMSEEGQALAIGDGGAVGKNEGSSVSFLLGQAEGLFEG